MSSEAAAASRAETEPNRVCDLCQSELLSELDCTLVNKKCVETKGSEPIWRCKPCAALRKRVNAMVNGNPQEFQTWQDLNKEQKAEFMKDARTMYGADLKKVTRYCVTRICITVRHLACCLQASKTVSLHP